MSEKMIVGKGTIFSRNPDETGLNNNSLVIGSSGAGKSVSIIVPFLLHTNESSVICSLSKRRVADQFIPYYKKMGYRVIDMNFEQPEKSEMCYDPIAYLCSTEDIAHLSSALVMSDSRKATSKADPYWDSTSINLLNALISMTMIFEEDATMDDVLRNADLLRIKPGCNHIETTLDDKFDLIVERDPHGFCANNWLVFSTLDSTKTASCIISSLQTILSTVFTSGLRSQISKKKCIDIERIGEEQTALFITTSAMNTALYTFVNLFYGQIFRSLFTKAQHSPGYKLPVRVSMCYDDFAVGGVAVKDFAEYTSIVREANMDFLLLLQSESQLVEAYGEFGSKTIMNNIDTTVFLGCNEYETAKLVSLKANIPVDEVLWQPVGSLICFRRGSRPILTERYDTYHDRKYIELMMLQDDKKREMRCL